MNWRALILKIFAGALVVALLAWFAYANSGQTIDLRLGLFTLRGVSLPIVLYGAVIIGMVVMVALGLRNDLRTQQALERYDRIAAGALHDVDEPDEQKEEVVEEAGGKS